MRISEISDNALRRVLIRTGGNVTRAASLLEISKAYIMRLTKKRGLRNFALELRLSSGCAATGRRPLEER